MDLRLLNGAGAVNGLLLQVGVGRAWGQGRRLVIDYGVVRGASGFRRVSELTLVLILDG